MSLRLLVPYTRVRDRSDLFESVDLDRSHSSPATAAAATKITEPHMMVAFAPTDIPSDVGTGGARERIAVEDGEGKMEGVALGVGVREGVGVGVGVGVIADAVEHMFR